MSQKKAKIISEISIPPVFAAIVFALLCFVNQRSIGYKFLLLIVCWATAWVFPIVYLLYLKKRGEISHLHVPIKEQRTQPYLIGSASYFLGVVILLLLHAPFLVWGVMVCYLTNTLIITAVNLHWKMSAHAMGTAGAIAGLHFAFGWVVAPLYLLIPLVGWARVKIRAHTIVQVLAGGSAGVLLTLIQLTLLSHFFN
jgi:membrane-associated phospholipid phosphatase